MENYKQYDELLIRYLTNEADAGERRFVEDWIGNSEENLRYFETLRNAWQLASVKQTLDYVIDELDVNKKWDQFKQNVTAKETRVIEQSESSEDERHIRKSIIKRLLIPAAIAASLIVVIGLGWIFFFPARQASVAKNTEIKKDSLVTIVRHEVNTTGKEKRIQLTDGSLIALASNSEITYSEPFTISRNITLIGKATFKVAKDKEKPFTVTSEAISTTALGTEFTVTAYRKNRQITVRLYEGKVVVKALDKANRKMKNDVYLLPGQEFVYGDKVFVRAFEAKDAAPGQIMNDQLTDDNLSIPENAVPYFMFNNQPLGGVLDDLAGLYNMKIIYDKKDVQNIYWTGKYDRSESLETILQRIGMVHNLTIARKENAFVISK